MSTHQKRYRAIIPTEPDTDLDLLRWLTRESFELRATDDGLVIVEYQDEGTVPHALIPPANAEHLDHPIEHYTWREFTALAVRPDPAPADPVCGYCQHPPHGPGECEQPAPTWFDPGAEPAACICVGDQL